MFHLFITSTTVPPAGQMAEVQQRQETPSCCPYYYFIFVLTQCRKYDNRQSDQQLYTHAYFYMLINDQLGLHSDVEAGVCY